MGNIPKDPLYMPLMEVLGQLDIDSLKRLYRADLPTPVDVLNLIHFKNEEAYKWYGVLTPLAA